VRATRYATSEDISAFQDSPTRQQRPSSSIEFIHIDHSDNESPLAPPNRSREMLDFASMSRSEATTRRGPAVSDAPVLQLTTTTGRSFTGRAVLQGTLWRVELDSGAVVSLPADRVVSSQPLGSN
jgi:hypothetical protein